MLLFVAQFLIDTAVWALYWMALGALLSLWVAVVVYLITVAVWLVARLEHADPLWIPNIEHGVKRITAATSEGWDAAKNTSAGLVTQARLRASAWLKTASNRLAVPKPKPVIKVRKTPVRVNGTKASTSLTAAEVRS